MDEEIKEETKKVQQWNHIAIRPETYQRFRLLKNTRSDNDFLIKLLKCWDHYMNKAQKVEVALEDEDAG